MGFVVLAGLFEPSTVVELYEVPDVGEQRVGAAAPLAGKRIADSSGSVGFDGLEVGVRHIARGYLDGYPVEVTVRAISELDGREIAQAPIGPSPQLQGTQESPLPSEPPAEPDAILHVGVPAGLVGIAA